MLSFYLFRKYFFSRRSLSLIRVVSRIGLAGVAVSVSALILIVSIMGGFGQSITNRLLADKPHLILSGGEESLKNLPESLREGIEDVVFYETRDVILKTREGFSGVVARGYDPRDWERTKNLVFKDSQATGLNTDQPAQNTDDFLKSNQVTGLNTHQEAQKSEKALNTHQKARKNTASDSPPLIIGHDLSLSLNLYEGDEAVFIPAVSLLLPPAEPLPLRRMRVAGVIPSTGDGEQALTVFYQKGRLDFGVFSKPQFRAEVRLKDPETASLYKEHFKSAATWRERNSALFFALKLEKFIMTLFIALALVISFLGISSALLLLMTQKGKDMGMFQAMGLSRGELCRVFSQMGFYLSLCGILLGTLMGLGGAAFFKYTQWNFLPEMYQDRTIPAVFEVKSYVLIVLGALLTAYPACRLPVQFLSRMEPARLLKITGR